MFSVSPAEALTIAVIALLVFGPKRLPEIARKAGRLLREIRGAASELKSGLEDEYREALEPIEDVRDTMRRAIAGIDHEANAAAAPGTPKPPPGTSAEADTPAEDPPEGPDDRDEA